MKSARVSLWNAKPSQNPKAPVLSGWCELPAQLVWELSQMLQTGQGLEQNQNGEQIFKLRISVWRGGGEANAAVLRGEIETPTERAAYLAQHAQTGVTAPAGPAWGAPAAAPAGPPPGWPGAPAAAPAGPPPGWPGAANPAGPPPGWPGAAAAPAGPPPGWSPAAAPAPAPAPAAPAWGGAGGWGG
jgi:hypothetical protein